MSSPSSLKVSIPIGFLFLLENALKLRPPNFKYIKDNFIFIASKVFSIPSKNKQLHEVSMVPISSTILRAEIGGDYRKYLDYLIDINLIISDRTYKVAKRRKDGVGKCIGFGFIKKLNKAKPEQYEIKRKSLIKRARAWDEIYKKQIRNDPTLFGLETRLKQITINLEKAETILNDLVKDGTYTQKKANSELVKCQKIADGHTYLIRDNFGRRIHTNLTSLSKYIRDGGCLSIDGETVVGIDIRSSQPAILHSIAVAQYEEVGRQLTEKYHIPSDMKDRYLNSERLNKTLNSSPFGHIGLGFKTLQDYHAALKSELTKMQMFLEKDIYDQFCIWWKEYFDRELKRSTIKQKWFAYVFGELDKQDPKMAKIWRYEFPIINRMIADIKDEDYCLMAKILQRRESEMVIEKLCPELNDVMESSYFTVHDSVFVGKSKVDVVKPLFQRILEEHHIVSGLVVS